MKKFKVFATHDQINTVDRLCEIMRVQKDTLPFELIWDDREPEYLFATFGIYMDRKERALFKKMYPYAPIAIFLAGEANAADFNIFDYALGFDRKLQFGDRYCRIPTRCSYSEIIFDDVNLLQNDPLAAKEELKKKSEFCNFIYSNALGHPKRKQLFEVVSKYKHVDSMGRYLNNKKVQHTYGNGDWETIVSEAIQLRMPYKFSISCENASYDGYTSEKIFSAFSAHTIPIYWGNPSIEDEINPKAFINCNDYDNLEDVIDVIKKIDRDDDLWCEMVSQPWMTKEQELQEEREKEYLRDFIIHIFTQPINKASRRGEGSASMFYRQWYFKQGRRSLNQVMNYLIDAVKRI